MKVVSNLRKISDEIPINLEPSVISQTIKKSVEIVEKGKKGKKGKGSKKDSEKSSKSSKSSKKSKGSKGTKGSKKEKPELPDPSIWTHYKFLSDQIIELNIYFKPSKMTTTITITDMESQTLKNSPTKKENVVSPVIKKFLSKEIKKYHNEPFYLFSDAMEDKFFVFNLSHVGNVMPDPQPKKKENKDKRICLKEICLRGFCEGCCRCQDKSEELQMKATVYDNSLR